MKINELGKLQQVSEGIGNWLARKGLSTAAGGMAAQNEYLSDLHQKNFTATLQRAYKQAVDAGIVNVNSGSQGPEQDTRTQATRTQAGAGAQPQQAQQNATTQQAQQNATTQASQDQSTVAQSTQAQSTQAQPTQAQPTQAQPTPQELAAQKRQQKLAAATQAANAQDSQFIDGNTVRTGEFSRLPDRQAAAGQSAFSNMASGLDKMGQKSPVTTLPPGSRQLGPKGRETLARLGKQKQDFPDGYGKQQSKQQSLDLNESDYSEFSALIESMVSEAPQTQGMSPGSWLVHYMTQQTEGSGIDISKFKGALSNLGKEFNKNPAKAQGIPADIAKKVYSFYASAAQSTPKSDRYGVSRNSNSSSGSGSGSGSGSMPTLSQEQKNTMISSLTDQIIDASRSMATQPNVINVSEIIQQASQLLAALNKQQFDKLLRGSPLSTQVVDQLKAAAQPQQGQQQPGAK